jgi:acyl-coenzyme A synthetase/AMP-(fatty) acid ligase
MTPETPPRRELLLRSAAALPCLMWLAACWGGGGGTAEAPARAGRLVIDNDIVSSLYLSGSTGRPDSIGKVILNAEILVLREDGAECAPGEPGELVHRGALVGQGYWNDAKKTAECYELLQLGQGGRVAGLQLHEFAVFSGDTVRCDAECFLCFVGPRDAVIKTSGYRVRPTEVEEVLYATRRVGECVAFFVDHSALGHAIQMIATAPGGTAALDVAGLLAECEARMPAYMVPQGVEPMAEPLPRNPNGKIDRKLLATAWHDRLETARVA